jgi:hypothetical protein
MQVLFGHDELCFRFEDDQVGVKTVRNCGVCESYGQPVEPASQPSTV